jgi:hypothetical protein
MRYQSPPYSLSTFVSFCHRSPMRAPKNNSLALREIFASGHPNEKKLHLGADVVQRSNVVLGDPGVHRLGSATMKELSDQESKFVIE